MEWKLILSYTVWLLCNENGRTALGSWCQLSLFLNFLDHFVFSTMWVLNSVLPLCDASLGKSFSKYGRTGQRASESCVRDGDGVSSRLVGTCPLGLSPSPCQDLARQWERDKEEMCKTESSRDRIQVWLKGRKHWKAFILGTSAWIKIFSSYSFCRETCKIMTVFLLTTFKQLFSCILTVCPKHTLILM